MAAIPLIDIAGLRTGDTSAAATVAEEIDAACRAHGFFVIGGHGIDQGLLDDLDVAARRFFALDDSVKAEVEMAASGRAWRGWFPVGGELTAGVPDLKEGYYFGRELPNDDQRVLARLPLHGPNPFPASVPELRELVLRYLEEMTQLGQALMAAMAIGLGLEPKHFENHLTATPTTLFRIFHYPSLDEASSAGTWGVAEHTDYGLLTILAQDVTGGLEVHTFDGWVEAPSVSGTFVCNIGDMLERMTGGAYRSTPHRVRPPQGDDKVGRLSFPFFFDPGWDVHVEPLTVAGEPSPALRERWDDQDPLAFKGTYGEYLTAKVAKVFPQLFERI